MNTMNMNASEKLRKEILRLAGVRRHPACINTSRIAALYNFPEKAVRRELANLAEEKLIRLSGWDGRQLRPYTAWPSLDEFINSTSDGGNLQVDLLGREPEPLKAMAAHR